MGMKTPMIKQIRKIFMIICLIYWSFACYSHAASAQTGNKTGNKDRQDGLLSRIDFGNSYIMGQTIKSGAVYLMQRKKSEIESMLKYRKSYRREILENFVVKGEEGVKAKGSDIK
jgi:hypothetical protein